MNDDVVKIDDGAITMNDGAIVITEKAIIVNYARNMINDVRILMNNGTNGKNDDAKMISEGSYIPRGGINMKHNIGT